MNLDLIKQLLGEKDEDLHEDDIVLAMECLMRDYRSVFLNQSVYDLSKEYYDTLKAYMLKATDISENKQGDRVSYFCIPVTLSYLQSIHYPSVIENVDPASIKQVLSAIPDFHNKISLGTSLVSRRTLFGGSAFNVYDTSRDAFLSQDDAFLEHDILINESQGEYVFYLIGKYNGDFRSPDHQSWNDCIAFMRARLSKCCGVSIEIHPPELLSVESYQSFFRDSSCRLRSELYSEDVNDINGVKLEINEENGSLKLLFIDDCKEVIAEIYSPNYSSLSSVTLGNYLASYAESINVDSLGLAKKNMSKPSSKIKRNLPNLTVIK